MCALAWAVATLVPLQASGQAYPVVDQAPALVGLDPTRPKILPVEVQAAYNDDTMFFHIAWEGDPGDYHDYVHYTGGAWQQEGFPRREAQSTLDNDPARGPTNRTSTIYESRVTWIIDDPSGPHAVADFGRFGCFITCHDNSRAMPLWDTSTDFTKYLNDGTDGALDLWHHRLARANPIGASDDQYVTLADPDGESGGRKRDTPGSSPWQTNNIVGGNPTYTLDNQDPLTGGLFAFNFTALSPNLFTNPLRYFRDPNALELGAVEVAAGIPWATATAPPRNYVPSEGDTIPRRRLRTPTENAGSITGYGSTFTPITDPLFGLIESNTQRPLDTGYASFDTQLANGGVYNIAFAVHTGQVTVRDHYVSFPMTLKLGVDPTADVEAVQVQGTGREPWPDFSDLQTFPITDVNLFLPGIASLEFLKNENVGVEYLDVNQQPIDQTHFGAFGMDAGLGCRDCHVAAIGDPFTGGGFFSGTMEELAPLRGGVDEPTPVPEPSAAVLRLVALGMLAVAARRRRISIVG